MSNLVNKTAKQISASKKEVTFNLQKYINEIIVIKYGGSAMLDKKLSLNFFQNIKALVDLDIKPIIVHGGGPQINELLDKLEIQSKFIDGIRVTDERTMEVVQMVLGGLVYKDVVTRLCQAGGKAVGLTGKAANLIQVKKLLIKLGMVFQKNF